AAEKVATQHVTWPVLPGPDPGEAHQGHARDQRRECQQAGYGGPHPHQHDHREEAGERGVIDHVPGRVRRARERVVDVDESGGWAAVVIAQTRAGSGAGSGAGAAAPFPGSDARGSGSLAKTGAGGAAATGTESAIPLPTIIVSAAGRHSISTT